MYGVTTLKSVAYTNIKVKISAGVVIKNQNSTGFVLDVTTSGNTKKRN